MKAIVERLTGPTISLVLHLVIIFAAYKFIRFVTDDPNKKIEIVVIDPETVDLEEFEQELEELEKVDEVVDNSMLTEAPMENDAPEVEDVAEESPDDLSDLAIMDIASPVVLKNVFAGRSKTGRMSAMGQYGGTGAGEEAVVNALEWLKKNQIKEGAHRGAWGPGQFPAMAGLGLLTFLAHGETPASERYGETVEMAIQYLAKSQDKDGTWKGTSHSYGHAIATYAISEAYAMTKIPSLRACMEKGVSIIVDGIGTKDMGGSKGSARPVKGIDSGGKITGGFWNYDYNNKDGRWDTSYAGWQAQALKAAKLAGSTNPKLAQTLDLAKNGFKYMHKDGGGFGYSGPATTPTMTGVGVLCLQLLGEGKSPEVQEGLAVLETHDYSYPAPAGKDKAGKQETKGAPVGKHNFYYVYYASQARFHAGGNSWKAWNKQFSPQLVKNQNSDGSWTPGSEGQGPAYTTSLGALTLMVYYRNLPTFKEEAVRASEPPPPPPESDDIELEII